MAKKSRAKMRPFVKIYGGGNDFILIDCLQKTLPSPAKNARRLCNRQTGIGADQLLLIRKSRKADYRMQIFNPDGSEAETCGNGLRAGMKFLQYEGITRAKEVSFENVGGIKIVKSLGRNFRVDMADPVMKGKEIPVNLSGRIVNRPLKLENKEFRITCLSMGNPHCIIYTEDLDNFPVEIYGPLLETHSIFPKKANIEFIQVVGREHIKMRVWERGAGETDGCGSGACAAAVASVLNGFTGRKVTVDQPGGKLMVEWDVKTSHVLLTGPAEVAFDGEIEI
jgi:diaminopimelate epimerase